MIERAYRFASEQGLLQPGDHVLVAVSGGVDSLVLLHLLRAWQQQLPLQLTVAHVDHSLRGEESAADLRFVEAIAAAWHLPFISKKIDVAAYADAQRLSCQMAARSLRYQFLASTARRIGAQKIATAHHLDDQAETVLMRLLRGTGLRGLGGIRPMRNEDGLTYIRPLLTTRRAEIEAYAQQEGLRWREDPSNQSHKYLRNRIRHELMPLLEQGYNPDVQQALAQTAAIARDDEEYLTTLALSKFNALVKAENDERMRVGAQEIAGLPLPLQRRVITLILYYLRGHTKHEQQAEQAVQHVHIESIRRLAAQDNPSAMLPLPGGLSAWREYDQLVVGVPAAAAPTETEVELVWDESVAGHMHTLTACGFRFVWQVVHGVPERPRDAWEIHLDADELSCARIYIRTWAKGDVFKPLGLSGRKLVSDVFTDAKIPKTRRERWPLLCADDDLLWVVGVRRSRLATVTDSTNRTLVLRATEQFSQGVQGSMHKDVSEILFTEEQVAERIRAIGHEINRDYEGRDLLMIGILKGASLFLAELVKRIDMLVDIDFMAVSSYGTSSESTGVVRILKDLDRAVEGRHVLIVEDIIDTGLTLQYLKVLLEQRGAASVKVCSLLDKPSRHKVDIEADYLGFSVPDHFIVGYGLDYAEKYRNLPYVGVLKPEVYQT